jgi:hypothetical protein
MSKRLSRRRFLTLALYTGLAVGCGALGSPKGSAGPTSPLSATSGQLAPGVYQPGMRFGLENDSISYGPHPRGCDVTSVSGLVRLSDGGPLAGMTVRLWADDPAQALDMTTNKNGLYAADVAQGTPHAVYHLQLLDPSKKDRLSDVIIAEATGSCKLNDLTVNFVPIS